LDYARKNSRRVKSETRARSCEMRLTDPFMKSTLKSDRYYEIEDETGDTCFAESCFFLRCAALSLSPRFSVPACSVPVSARGSGSLHVRGRSNLRAGPSSELPPGSVSIVSRCYSRRITCLPFFSGGTGRSRASGWPSSTSARADSHARRIRRAPRLNRRLLC
jgi:hypothetical protein